MSADGRRGLGVYCKGDGSGALITVAIRNLAMNSRKASEHYIVADFVGWRYFAFYETQNATQERKAPKHLEYKNYNHLQEFYGYYRAKMNYGAIDGIDITVEGSESICLRPILLTPHAEPPIIDPTLRFGESEMKIFTSLKPGTNLYFDGTECVVSDSLGYEIERPAFIGAPILKNGKNELHLIREDNAARARLTIITEGEELQ